MLHPKNQVLNKPVCCATSHDSMHRDLATFYRRQDNRQQEQEEANCSLRDSSFETAISEGQVEFLCE